jgi:XTP/dITP diphosphohydrolase
VDLSKGILIATGNKGKLAEIQTILGNVNGLKLFSLKDPGFHKIDVEENGRTFKENAFVKASEYARKFSMVTLGDDSGLEVDYLGGNPGVNSARYAGPGASDGDLVRKLLKELQGVGKSQRGAAFKCVVCLYDPAADEKIFSEGECRGHITDEPAGSNGFGYDPVFVIADIKKTMAEIDPALKNRISHRAKALDGLRLALEHLELI